jgi:hypothetical protein
MTSRVAAAVETCPDLDDLVESLRGIGTVLMEISARLEAIERLLRGGDDAPG